MTLQIGNRFTSQILGKDIVAKIMDIDLLHNVAVIEISKNGNDHKESWDLEELIWSFEKGECNLIKTNSRDNESMVNGINHLSKMSDAYVRPNKHNQLENEGAYSD